MSTNNNQKLIQRVSDLEDKLERVMSTSAKRVEMDNMRLGSLQQAVIELDFPFSDVQFVLSKGSIEEVNYAEADKCILRILVARGGCNIRALWVKPVVESVKPKDVRLNR